MRNFLSGILIVIFVAALSSAVHASGVGLDKREVWLQASAGEKITGSVTFINQDAQPVTVNAYFEDMIFNPPYTPASRSFAPAGTAGADSCAEWITLGLREFIVPAGQKQEVPFTVQVPPDAQGGYYAILFFETRNTPAQGERAAMGLILRSGCSFFIETGGTQLKADVTDISYQDKTLSGSLVNQGSSLIAAEGSFYIMNADGIAIARGALGKYYLPREKKAEFKGTLTDEIPAGAYIVVVNFGSRQGLNVFKEFDIVKSASGSVSVGGMRD